MHDIHRSGWSAADSVRLEFWMSTIGPPTVVVGGRFPDLGKNVNPVLGNFGKFVVGAIPLDNISQIGELFRS